MVQDQESTEGGEHHSTIASEVKLHEQWLMYQGAVTQEQPPTFQNVSSELSPVERQHFLVPLHAEHSILRNELMVPYTMPSQLKGFSISFSLQAIRQDL